MILILTNSMDGTTDELVRSVGADNIFRLNIDLWHFYQLRWNKAGFRLQDPSGRSLTDNDIRCLYWRKPTFDDPLDPEDITGSWLRDNISYTLHEIYNYFRRKNLLFLVDKDAERHLGKINSLVLAADYFSVPDWELLWNSAPSLSDPLVTKSLVPSFVEANKFLYTVQIPSKQELSNEYPWFVQAALTAADYDITVAFVEDEIFPYRLDRKTIDGLDWRVHINQKELAWESFEVPLSFAQSIRSYMRSLMLNFGRLDFLQVGSKFYFLEVNPNGQWGWLDMKKDSGLFQCISAKLLNTLS